MRTENIAPLSKRKGDGSLYKRPPDVESAICVALEQDLPALLMRVAIRGIHDTDFMPTECLLHLVRTALRNNDEKMRDALVPHLFARCHANLCAKLPKAPDLREEVSGLFAELLAEDGAPGGLKELDFFEVRFNAAFAALRTDAVRKYELRSAREKVLSPLAEGEATDSEIDEAQISQSRAEVLLGPSGRLLRGELQEQLCTLSEGERRAIVLHYLYGFEVESIDKSKDTVATLCKATGRTIRNRLANGITKLKAINSNQ